MSTEFNKDGYMSVLTGTGTFRDPETTAAWMPPILLNPKQLSEMFMSGGTARRIVEGPAEEMIRPWFTVAGDKGKEVLDVLETIGAQELVTSASVWSRLFGGSAVVFSVDAGNYSSPLRSFRKINGGRSFDNNQVNLRMDRLSSDPVRQLNGLPQYIEVSVSRGMGSSVGATVLVHEDRFCMVSGARTPNQVRENTGWDAPILQHCHDAIVRYTMGLGYTSNILRDFVQGVLSVKDLSGLLAAGKEEVVRERLRLLDLSRSILNTMLLDAEGEQYVKSTSSVAGLEGILDRYLEQLSMACGIPVAKLAGRSAGGLNSTGDNDLKNYYDMLAAERKRTITPVVERLVQLVYLSAEGPTGGVEPENWSIQWNPFFQLTDVEEANLRKSVADTDKIYLDARVISPAEVANSRFAKGEWSMETEIDDTEQRATFEDMANEQLALIEAQKSVPAPDEERTDAAHRTLYVSRRLINASDLRAWAKEQGIQNLEDDLHVTVTYSRTPVDWMKMGASWEAELKLPAGGPRLIEQFDGGAVVLAFASSELKWRNQSMIEQGASWDYEEYQPHVTLTYESGVDVSKIEPYTGELVFGPEIFEEIRSNEDSADQPRVPAGSPAGGQFASKGSAALVSNINSLPDHPTFENSKKNPLDTDNTRWGRDPGSAAIYKFAKENGPFPEKEVKISSISSDQDNVYVPQLMKLAEGTGSGETPIVLDRGEKGYRVIDGNHRIVLEKLKGEEDVKVQVLSVKDKKLEQYLLSVGMDKYELMTIRGDSKSNEDAGWKDQPRVPAGSPAGGQFASKKFSGQSHPLFGQDKNRDAVWRLADKMESPSEEDIVDSASDDLGMKRVVARPFAKEYMELKEKHEFVAPSFPQDAKLISDKEGTNYQVVKREQGGSSYIPYRVKDVEGKEVAFADYVVEKNRIMMVRTESDFRRKGIATALYDFIGKEHGKEVLPNPTQTEEGSAFWKNRKKKK